MKENIEYRRISLSPSVVSMNFPGWPVKKEQTADDQLTNFSGIFSQDTSIFDIRFIQGYGGVLGDLYSRLEEN